MLRLKCAGLVGPAWIRITPEEVSLLDVDSWDELYTWPLHVIKRFGKDDGIFSFQAGSAAKT